MNKTIPYLCVMLLLVGYAYADTLHSEKFDTADAWDIGTWELVDNAYCDSNPCMREGNSENSQMNWTTFVNTSKCARDTAVISGRFGEEDADSAERLYMWLYEPYSAATSNVKLSEGGVGNAKYSFSTSGLTTPGVNMGFYTTDLDAAEYYYMDNVSVDCTLTSTRADQSSHIMGTVLDMPFTANSSTVAANVADPTANGTVSGATWTSSGKYGGAYSGNSTKQSFISTPIKPWEYSSFTLSGWFKMFGTGTSDILMSRQAVAAATGLAISSTTVTIAVYNGTNVYTQFTFASGINNWHHYLLTYDNVTGNASLYVDGAFSKSMISTGAVPLSKNITMGSALYDLNGTIDEVRIWNRALTAADVLVEYSKGVNPAVKLDYPLNARNITGVNIDVRYNVSGVLLDSCSYILDGADSVALPTCANFTLTDLPRGAHTLGVYVLDSDARVASENVSFSNAYCEIGVNADVSGCECSPGSNKNTVTGICQAVTATGGSVPITEIPAVGKEWTGIGGWINNNMGVVVLILLVLVGLGSSSRRRNR